jgi:hypothetical protein
MKSASMEEVCSAVATIMRNKPANREIFAGVLFSQLLL